MRKSTYTTASLDEALVNDLKKVHEKCLAPLGITYSNPAVIRHLVKYHNMSNHIHSDLVHESLVGWKEESDDE